MILITGGGGLLGLNLARDFVDKGKEVLLLQRHEIDVPCFLAPFWDNQVKGIVGDVLDFPFICSLMTEYPIDSIVHAAAVWPGRAGITSLYNVVSINVMATINILEVTRIFRLKRMTFISSTTVYLGLDTSVECLENLPLPTTSPHIISSTKKASENICNAYKSAFGLSVPIVRVARIYGPAAHWKINPLERMVVNAVTGKPVELFDTYEGSKACPIYAKDCATGISFIHLKKSLRHDIYNLSGGSLITYKEIASVVEHIVPGADIQLGCDKRLDVSHPPVSIERLESEGWTPKYAEIKKGIEDYADYIREGRY